MDFIGGSIYATARSLTRFGGSMSAIACMFALRFQAHLRDEDIELELERMFGLPDDPDISEDEYEGEDDIDPGLGLCSILENRNTPGPSRRSSANDDELTENIDPNIPGPSRRSTAYGHDPIRNVEDSDDEEILRPIRPSRILNARSRIISESSESFDSSSESSADEEDANGWKKCTWSGAPRPSAEQFDEGTLKPKVFFPSRTSPAAFFSRYFSDEVMDHILEQTNLYASQKHSPNWEPVTRADIDAFLGIIILMGIHVLPSIDLYWSSDPFFRVDEIAQVMTCKRFKKILENLHLNDNSMTPSKTSPEYDKLYKVRPVLDMINSACQREAKQTNSQSIDEAMIRFKGVSSLKQYMPAKPIKRGFKVWVRADSVTGYVYEFKIYTGKNDDNTPELGLGANVVKSLSKSLIDEHIQAHVAFDNFFASYPLMQYLYENGIFSTATVNTNRADLPKFIKEQKGKGKVKLDRGKYKWRVKNDVGFMIWKDTKNVTVMSTAFHPKEKTACQRTIKDGTKKSFPCPLAITEYTKRMGGVDRFDQKRGTYEVGRRNRRWWCRIFYFLIDLAATNAFLLKTSTSRNHGPSSILQFRISIARSLIGNHTTRKRSLSSEPYFVTRKKKTTANANYQKVVGVQDDVRYIDVGKHMIDKSETPHRCRLCSTKTKNVRSKLSCTTCKVFLCAYPCFTKFHQRN